MELRNSEHYVEIAGALRLRARLSEDLDIVRRLREAAIKHEQHARRLRRLERSVYDPVVEFGRPAPASPPPVTSHAQEPRVGKVPVLLKMLIAKAI